MESDADAIPTSSSLLLRADTDERVDHRPLSTSTPIGFRTSGATAAAVAAAAAAAEKVHTFLKQGCRVELLPPKTVHDIQKSTGSNRK